MRFASCIRPVKYQVSSRHELHLHDIFIEWIFTRTVGFHPYTSVSLAYYITVLKAIAAKVFSIFTHIADHHTYISDWHIGHWNFLNLYRPWIDVITTCKNDRWLQASVTIMLKEGIEVLEIIMSFYLASRNL